MIHLHYWMVFRFCKSIFFLYQIRITLINQFAFNLLKITCTLYIISGKIYCVLKLIVEGRGFEFFCFWFTSYQKTSSFLNVWNINIFDQIITLIVGVTLARLDANNDDKLLCKQLKRVFIFFCSCVIHNKSCFS